MPDLVSPNRMAHQIGETKVTETELGFWHWKRLVSTYSASIESCAMFPALRFHLDEYYDKYSGSMKIITRLDHISHCKTTFGANGSNRWTYRVFIANTRRD